MHCKRIFRDYDDLLFLAQNKWHQRGSCPCVPPPSGEILSFTESQNPFPPFSLHDWQADVLKMAAIFHWVIDFLWDGLGRSMKLVSDSKRLPPKHGSVCMCVPHGFMIWDLWPSLHDNAES